MHESALSFCDQFGMEAHRLGRTAPELFAVHPEHGTIRLDAYGYPMIGGGLIESVEACERSTPNSAGATTRRCTHFWTVINCWIRMSGFQWSTRDCWVIPGRGGAFAREITSKRRYELCQSRGRMRLLLCGVPDPVTTII